MRSMLAVSAVVAAAFTVPASAAVIDLSTLNLAGSAALVGNQLQLTNTTSQSGAGWVKNSISTSQSFSTSFSFSLLGNDSGKMADGIALAFQNAGNNVTGNGGGDVGYWNIGGSGSSAVGSVIRSWHNNDYGLSTNGVVQGLKTGPFNLGASNNVTGTETVSYNATTHVLTLSGNFLDGSTNTSYSISDSKVVDLSAKFGSSMYIGFTGGTGGTDADQRITAFSISAVPEPETYAMLLAGLGIMGLLARRRKAC
ncbi:PEP-CTERM sorting domain-containing protein [Duganella sp. CY15W]|uniref:PEP-CTERM sorting domain-containing protein n=1 Tax=Duganella sp. CY15W TaxID=2692172 RepID=UPI00136CECA5|nr:PEP-CTERM sorting domain-containing protein [Duganella sp. CY15W]MYM31984.1 PEP-CTERM sorting domain-containing protein [Duganella sp. CY15W]